MPWLGQALARLPVGGGVGRASSPADRYVAKTGTDSGNGSSGAPWLTVQYAATNMTAGDVVSVGPGTYDERVTITSAKSGAAGNPTQFIASETVVVAQGFEIQSDYTDLAGFEVTPGSTAINDASWRGQVWVRGSYVTLTGLNIHDCTYASAICLGSTEDHITIDGCTLHHAKHSGIGTDNGSAGDHAHNVTVRNCTMTEWGGGCAIMAYGDDWLIEECEIQGVNAGWNGSVERDGDGIWPNFSNHSIIRRCRIYDIWQAVTYAESGYHADCIQLWDSCTNLLVDSCRLGSWKEGGIGSAPGPLNLVMAQAYDTACSATFQNCVFLDGISADGLKRNTHTFCGDIAGTGTLAITLYNNTFLGNAPSFSGGGAITYVLRNNAFYAHRGSWWEPSSDSNYNAYMWNQWSDQSLTGLQDATLYASEGASSLGQSYATRLVAADIFENPDVSVTTNYGLTADFSTKSGSALIGAGEYSAAYPQTDITGAARSNPPSIGAYE